MKTPRLQQPRSRIKVLSYINEFVKLTLATLGYVLLAEISRRYFTEFTGIICVIWLPSGFSLAMLIIGGKKYLPSIFLGSAFIILMHDNSLPTAIPMALGSTFAAFFGLLLLTNTKSFNSSFYRASDFFILSGIGLIVSSIAAAIGTVALWANGIIPQSEIFTVFLHWAQGDAIGIISITPLILAWRKLPNHWFSHDRLLETASFLSLLTVVEWIIFLDLFQESLGPIARGYWIFLFMAWAAVRFGIRGVTLVTAFTTAIALLGTIHHQGFFGQDLEQTYLANFWFYIVALSCVGMKLIQSIRQGAAVQASLSQMRDRFNHLVDAFPLPIALNDASQNIVFLNAEFFQLFGYTLVDIPTLEDWWPLAYPDRAYRDWVRSEWQIRMDEAARTGKPFQAMELKIRCKDGLTRTALVAAAPLDNKFADTHLVSLVDISDRKKMEEELLKSEEHLRLSQEGGGIGTWEADLIHDSQTWSQSCYSILGFEKRGEPKWTDFLDLIYPEDRQRVIDAFDAHVHRGEKYDVEYRAIHRNAGTRWFRSTGQVERDSTGNPVVMRGIVQDITDRKRIEDSLRESEREFRQLAEAMPQIVWACKADGSNIYFNQQWVKYTGLSLAESCGQGWNTPFHPDDKQRAWDAWQNAVTNLGEYSLECRLRRADGVYQWWLIRGVPIVDENGTILKWFGTCTDIHNLKLTEQALRDSEARRHFALEGNDQGVWDWDIPAGTVFFTSRWKSMLGFADDEITDCLEEWSSRVHPDDLPAVMDDVHKHFSGETSHYQNEHRVRHRSGDYIWILDRGKIVSRDADGQALRMIGTHTDISERKSIEEALAQKNRLLNDSQAIAHIGSWQVDIKTRQLNWSDESFRLYGLSPEHDPAPTWDQFLTLLYPEDRSAMQAWSNACLAGLSPPALEFRTYPIDGEYRWLLGLGQLETTPDGAPMHILGTVQDITEMKRITRERQLWADAFQYCAHGIAMGNPETESIATCNPSFAKLLGYDRPEDIENRKILSLYAPEYLQKIKGNIQKADEAGHNSYEGQMLRKDGSRVDVQLDLVCVKDVKNKVMYRIATIQDMTLRKQAEEKMRLQVSAMEASANSIMIADHSGAIEWVNRAFTDMTGYRFDEINGVNYLDFPRLTDNQSDFDDMWQTVMNGRVWHGELVNQHKNGSQFPVEQVVTPVVDDQGQIRHIIAIKQNISQRKAMELALKQSLQNYRQLSNHLETIREEERIRIAREIHDELGGFLTVLKIDLSLLSKQMPKDLVDCHEKTEDMKQSIHQGLKTIKRIINDLRPSVLDHLGLVPALEWLAENIIRRANIICIMKIFDQAIEVSPELKTTIFRVTQEAFVNIVRHAKASHVMLVIEFSEDSLLITIKDNGCGMTQEQMMKSGSFGIQGMRERIRYFGGDLTIESSPQIGTLLRIIIPNFTHVGQEES